MLAGLLSEMKLARQKHAVSDLKLSAFSQEIHINNLTKWFHFRKNALSKWVANAKMKVSLSGHGAGYARTQLLWPISGHIWAYAVRHELIRTILLGWIRSVPAKRIWLDMLELIWPSELIRLRFTKTHLPITKKQHLTELVQPIRYRKLRTLSLCRLDTLTSEGLGPKAQNANIICN